MKLLTEQLTDAISKELSNSMEEQKLVSFDKFIKEMKKAGLIKQPIYNFPLVDTIGKTYYASINKHK